jgi:hypothetical protein
MLQLSTVVHTNAVLVSYFNYLSTGEPTYWPNDYNKLPDLLDFFIYKGITTNYIEIESNYELSSDHTPVIATLSTRVIFKPTIPTLAINRTNWNCFRTYIEDHINMKINRRVRPRNPILYQIILRIGMIFNSRTTR